MARTDSLNNEIWASSGLRTKPDDDTGAGADLLTVAGGNIDAQGPFASHMNWWQNRTDRVLNLVERFGIMEWSASTEYALNGVCMVGGVIYKSLADNNKNNQISDTTKWVKYEPPGMGDMLASVYDKNGDGMVDTAKKVEGVEAALSRYYYGKNENNVIGFWELPPDGDMKKSVYDTTNNGVVDKAEAIEGADTAGNAKYYGTNPAGRVGFYDVPPDGDMLKRVYDTDDSGRVDHAEAIWGIIGAGDSSFYGKDKTGAVGFHALRDELSDFAYRATDWSEITTMPDVAIKDQDTSFDNIHVNRAIGFDDQRDPSTYDFVSMPTVAASPDKPYMIRKFRSASGQSIWHEYVDNDKWYMATGSDPDRERFAYHEGKFWVNEAEVVTYKTLPTPAQLKCLPEDGAAENSKKLGGKTSLEFPFIGRVGVNAKATNLTQPGFYRLNENISDGPSFYSDYGQLIYSKGGDTNLQIISDFRNGHIAFRTYNDETAAAGDIPWNEFYTTANKPTKADIGLSNVPNYGISHETTGVSKTAFASEFAVGEVGKKAQEALDKANAASQAGTIENANKWSSPMTLNFGGDVSGKTAFDGHEDVTVTINVQDNSHRHTWDNIDGKPTGIINQSEYDNTYVRKDGAASNSEKLGGRVVSQFEQRDTIRFSNHYCSAVMLLIPFAEDADRFNASLFSGRIDFHRGAHSSSNRTETILISAKSAYNQNEYSMVKQSLSWRWRFCTVMHKGKKWLALQSAPNVQDAIVYFSGIRFMASIDGYDQRDQFTVIPYYVKGSPNTPDGVLDQEINDSVSILPWDEGMRLRDALNGSYYSTNYKPYEEASDEADAKAKSAADKDRIYIVYE